MSYLTRSQWGAEPPVKTLPLSKHLKGTCVHWMGFPIHDDSATIVRSIQRNHMGPPKSWWDIAYNELIDQDGTIIEGRGLTVRCGANGGTALNKSYVALGLLIGPHQPPTEAMIEAVRSRIAIVQHFQPQATKIVGHKNLKPTTCPGPHVMAHIIAGTFEPGSADVAKPEGIEHRFDDVNAEIAALWAAVEEINMRLPA